MLTPGAPAENQILTNSHLIDQSVAISNILSAKTKPYAITNRHSSFPGFTSRKGWMILLFAPVPCSASINKSSAYHFGLVRVRILWISATMACLLLSRCPFFASALFAFSPPPPPYPFLFFHVQLTKRGNISPSFISEREKDSRK